MAKKGGKSSGKISNGGRQKANVAHTKKRMEKFAAKRGTEKEYKYQPISAKPGTNEYERERLDRAEKAKSSKLPYARMTSIFAKLDNEIAKQKLEDKSRREKKFVKREQED